MTTAKKLRSKVLLLTGIYLIYSVFNSGAEFDQNDRKLSQEGQRELIGTEQTLEFVHIARNGGKAIEKAACESGVSWGYNHYNADSENNNCHDDDLVRKLRRAIPKENDYPEIAPWHTPPRMLLPRAGKDENPFHGKKLFTVVRNPYTRLLSEYYDRDTGFKGTPEQKNDPEVLNHWVQRRLRNVDSRNFELDHHESENGENMLQHNGIHHESHYVTQVEYVYHTNGTRAVDHVLYFENLKPEFDNLMERYGLNITLPVQEFHEGDVDGEIFTYKDFNNQTLMDINHIAGPDFEAFGYTMIQPIDSIYELDVDNRAQVRMLFKHDVEYNDQSLLGPCLLFTPVDNSHDCDRLDE